MLKIKKKIIIRYNGQERVCLPNETIDVKKIFKIDSREAELLETRYCSKLKGCVERIVEKKEEQKKEAKKEKAKVNDNSNISR